MEIYRIPEAELRFAEIVWKNAPLRSPELVELCARELGWKKSTTYTVLRRLCEKGIFKNEDALVSVLVSREEHGRLQGEQVISRGFGGSLPKFLAAFINAGKLTPEQIAEIRAMIDAAEDK